MERLSVAADPPLRHRLEERHAGYCWLGWRHVWQGSGSGGKGLACYRLSSEDRGSCGTFWWIGLINMMGWSRY